MNINKIVKMKNNKYKICFEDQVIITYDNVILENDLLYKKSIDKKLYDKVLNDTSFYDIYNKAVKYILKKRRSEKEVLKYLYKYNISDKDISNILSKLKNLNLINDIEYCRAYINDKVYLSKCGINKIKIDLLEQNIPIEVIETELDKIDRSVMDDRLEKLIIKKIKSNHKYSNQKLKSKILNDMINLGYSKEKIIFIIEKNIQSEEKIESKEFEKCYTKLKAKYNGNELNQKVKQKLYSKGFSIDRINNFLQEKTEN